MIISSAILEISLKRLIFNHNFFKNLNKKNIVAGILKANAYGLGSKEVFKTLYKNGCRDFFVATINEGIQLRKIYNKSNIYILNGTENNKLNLFKKKNLIPIINSFEELKLFNNNTQYGIHVDTGFNRLGLNINNFNKKILKDKNLKILISHLASADEYNNPYNDYQRKLFETLTKEITKKNIICSLSGSQGSILSKKYLFNMIRPGIGIYGGHNNTKLKKFLKPVIKLKAKILQIKKILKNEYIGYNQTYKTKQNIFIAIIAIGYGDGVFRLLSNNGYFYYKNKRFKILGRVSMDTTTINITKNYKIFTVGDYVEIINYEHGIDELANKCNTISHEILTSITKRVQRKYE